MTSSFVDQLIARVSTQAREPALRDNVDPERFPAGMTALTPAESADRLTRLLDHASELEWLSGVVPPDSRALLSDRLVFAVLGPAHARVGPSLAEVQALLDTAASTLIQRRDVTPLRYAGSAHSHLFDLRPLKLPITLESYLLGVQGTFQLAQYRAPRRPAAWPRPGDVAIDAGGCFGETALWLAHAVGPAGRVVSLEFSPENLEIMRGNLARNPALAERITLEEKALWRRSEEVLSVEMAGPASTITRGEAGDQDGVRTITLDDLVSARALERVDFVKMDIEGAEPAALAGATGTLARWRPRLALAVYHDISHLWELPRRLAAMDLGYRFALGHFTMHDEETVLYAWPEAASGT